MGVCSSVSSRPKSATSSQRLQILTRALSLICQTQASSILLLWIVDVSNIDGFLDLWGVILRVILLCEWLETPTRLLAYRSARCGDYLSICVSSNATLMQELLLVIRVVVLRRFGVHWIILDRHISHVFLPFLASASRMRVTPKRSPNRSRVVPRRLEIVIENLLRAACVRLASTQIARKLVIARSTWKLVFYAMLLW